MVVPVVPEPEIAGLPVVPNEKSLVHDLLREKF
jgi:hypothetical protein